MLNSLDEMSGLLKRYFNRLPHTPSIRLFRWTDVIEGMAFFRETPPPQTRACVISDSFLTCTPAPTNPGKKVKSKHLVALFGAWLATMFTSMHGAENEKGRSSDDGTSLVVLSPFQVNVSQDKGYIATNSLSGSRVNTPLYTTPSVTSVFTRDFLDDIGANDMVEAYSFGLNVDAIELPEQSSNFRPNITSRGDVNIRGLGAAPARNYFVWPVNGDLYNVERIDFSRGPNNVLFGLGGFGGVVNSTTKRAVIGREITAFQFQIGDWDLYRGHLDVSRSLGKKAAIRVNLLDHKEKYWKHHAFYDRLGMHLAGTYEIINRPEASTILRADFEKLNSNRVIGARFPFKNQFSDWNGAGVPTSGSLAGVVGTAAMTANRRLLLEATNQFILTTGQRRTLGPTGTSLTDESIVPREANFNGPNAPNDSDVQNYTVIVEQRVLRDIFFEFAYNRQSEYYTRDRADFGFDLFRDPQLTLNGAPNPHFGDYFSDYQYDTSNTTTKVGELRGTASYEREFGIFGKHQFAVLASRRVTSAYANSFTFDDIGTGAVLMLRRYIKDGDGPSNTGFDPNKIAADAAKAGLNVGYRQSALTRTESLQNTLQGAHVGGFFSGRLTTILGIRNDKLFNRSVLNGFSDVNTTEPLFKRRRVWNNYQLSDWSYAAGDITRTKGFTLGWSATSPVRLYYNESGSFVNQNVNRLVSLYERNSGPLPRLGEGKDMGIRFQLFGGRVQGSVGRFEVTDRNSTPGLHGYFFSALSFVGNNLFKRTDVTNYADTISVVSKGHEAELTANVTKNFRLHLNYSHTELTNSDHAPDTKKILIGQMLPQWRSWVSGWRQGAGEVLPAGVANNTAPAVNVPDLGRPLTFLEAHGEGIDPVYNLNDRRNEPTVTGALGLSDWISRVNWASDIWFQDGLPPRRHRPDAFNVVGNYTFDRDSRLKGWTVGAGARWRGKPILDRYFDPNSNVIVLYGDPRVDTDLNIGYTYKFKRFTLKTQLNVKNVFNSDTVEVVNVAGNSDERGHLQYQDPRSFRLTVNFIH
jgi:outer membrane receptor protein involved in Fe transport